MLAVVDDLHTGFSVMTSLGVWFGMAAFFWGLAAALLWWLSRQEKRVAVQVAELAAMLPGGAGPFPGRTHA